MQLAFVTPAQAEGGHTSTFSFNLRRAARTKSAPPRPAICRWAHVNAARPLQALCVLRPGQREGVLHGPCNLDAGRHQGRGKAKQAVGGVQLARLSFPPSIDTAWLA